MLYCNKISTCQNNSILILKPLRMITYHALRLSVAAVTIVPFLLPDGVYTVAHNNNYIGNAIL